MILKEDFKSKLRKFKDLKPGDCLRTKEDDRCKMKCVYYIKLEAPVKQWKDTFTAVRLSDGVLWPIEPDDDVYFADAEVIIRGLSR